MEIVLMQKREDLLLVNINETGLIRPTLNRWNCVWYLGEGANWCISLMNWWLQLIQKYLHLYLYVLCVLYTLCVLFLHLKWIQSTACWTMWCDHLLLRGYEVSRLQCCLQTGQQHILYQFIYNFFPNPEYEDVQNSRYLETGQCQDRKTKSTCHLFAKWKLPKLKSQWMTCFGSSLWTGISMASVNIVIITINIIPITIITITTIILFTTIHFQVIGYNSLLVSQLQREKNPDLVFTFELASWICFSSPSSSLSSSPCGFANSNFMISHRYHLHHYRHHQHQHQHIFHHDHQPPSPPASLWATASVAGCLLGSILSDLLGRRKALMVLRSTFITAWCLGFLLLSSHTSPQPPGMSVPVLLLLLFLLEAQCHYVLCHSKWAPQTRGQALEAGGVPRLPVPNSAHKRMKYVNRLIALWISTSQVPQHTSEEGKLTSLPQASSLLPGFHSSLHSLLPPYVHRNQPDNHPHQVDQSLDYWTVELRVMWQIVVLLFAILATWSCDCMVALPRHGVTILSMVVMWCYFLEFVFGNFTLNLFCSAEPSQDLGTACCTRWINPGAKSCAKNELLFQGDSCLRGRDSQ